MNTSSPLTVSPILMFVSPSLNFATSVGIGFAPSISAMFVENCLFGDMSTIAILPCPL